MSLFAFWNRSSIGNRQKANLNRGANGESTRQTFGEKEGLKKNCDKIGEIDEYQKTDMKNRSNGEKITEKCNDTRVIAVGN